MSNSSLIARIQTCLKLVEAQQSTTKALADSLRVVGRALEAMPYTLAKEIESMAMDLDIAQWHDESGFVSELDPVLIRVKDWLRKVPVDA